MKNQVLSGVTFVICAILLVTSLNAATTGGVYDMSRLLREPHPFAKIHVTPKIELKTPKISQPTAKSLENELNKVLPVKKSKNKKLKYSKLLSNTQSKYNSASNS